MEKNSAAANLDATLADLEAVNDEIAYREIARGANFECGLVRFLPRAAAHAKMITHTDRDVLCHAVRGRGRLRVGEDVLEVVPGAVLHIPAGTPHDFAAGDGPFVLLYTLIVHG